MQTLKMISDTQFESMGLAIGHVGKRKALKAEISGAQISEVQKEARIRNLVDKIRKK